MRPASLCVVGAAAFALLASLPATAQDPAPPPPYETAQASLADATNSDQPSPDLAPPLYAVHVTGSVTVTRDGAASVLEINAPVIDGDRVRSTAGRAELGAAPWGSLFLDERSVVDVVSPERVRLVEGRLRLEVNDWGRVALRVSVPGGTILPSEAGSYTVETGGPRGDESALFVRAGRAEFQGEAGALVLRAGEGLTVGASGRPHLTTSVASAGLDDFNRWVDSELRARRSSMASSSPSGASSSLPPDLSGYSATLEQYGRWGEEPDYGQVWYPTVALDWQPYTYGRWDRVGHYGWFWIGGDPWAWPTHHYGRWGYRGGRWFWAPGRVWAPSWVHWAVGPGYVGWCPLGYDDRPVFGFGFGGVAYYRGGRFDGHDRWRGWSLVPRQHFESRQAVRRGFIDPQSLPQSVTASFVTQRVPPLGGGRASYAIPRALGPAGSGPGTTYRRGSPGDGGGPPEGAVPPGHAVPRGGGSGATPPSPSPYDRARPYMGRGGGTAAGSRGKSSPTEGPATGDVPATAVPRGGRHVPGSDGRLGAGTPPPHTRTGDRSRGPGDAPADPGTAGAPRAPGGRTLPSPPPSGQSAPPSRRPEGQAVPRTVAPKQGGGAKYR